MATIGVTFFSALASVGALFLFYGGIKNEKQIRRSALLAVIATVLEAFIGAILINGILQFIGYGDWFFYLRLSLIAVSTIISVFSAVYFGCKYIFKKRVSAIKIIPVSVGAVILEVTINYFITINLALLNYIVTFVIFSGLILIIDKGIEN